jgi:hypothetical protein
MKKIYTTAEYVTFHNRRSLKISKGKRNKKYIPENLGAERSIISIPNYNNENIKLPLIAPEDLRLVDNTEVCLLFFRNLRSMDCVSNKRNLKFVIISLKNVTQIDYASISVLTSISDDLKYKNILLKGDFPLEPISKQFMIDSGFLNHMFEEKTGKPFPKAAKSEMIFFEKGCGKLSLQDNIRISKTVKNVVNHLTGEISQCLSVKTIVLEICGNSIEWGGTENKQWLLGVKYDEDKVTFTVTDVGKGILDTLYRKHRLILVDIFMQKTNDEILAGAFNQKYGSSTQEINRNKGLPAVKHNNDIDVIRNLKVLTNNVILHFNNSNNTRTFKKGSPRFKGTFYQWEMTKECINNIKTSGQ